MYVEQITKNEHQNTLSALNLENFNTCTMITQPNQYKKNKKFNALTKY